MRQQLLPGDPAWHRKFPQFSAANRQAARTPQIPSASAWAATTLGFTPDVQQSRVLDLNQRRVLVNCSRQWGKSTTAAVRALHHATHNPDSETILIAPYQRQSAELMRKISKLSKAKLKSGNNGHARLLPNGARILALPGKHDSIRGFSKVSLLIIDEAAFVPDPLYYAVRPFLAASPDATLLVMSTPNGDSGFLYYEWIDTRHEWTRITVTAHDCPRISAAFLAEEQSKMPAQVFRQEYLCEFLSHQRAVFNREMVDRFFSFNNFGPVTNILLEP